MYFCADFDYNIGIGEYRRNGGVIGLEQEGKLKFAGKDTVFRDTFFHQEIFVSDVSSPASRGHNHRAE